MNLSQAPNLVLAGRPRVCRKTEQFGEEKLEVEAAVKAVPD